MSLIFLTIGLLSAASVRATEVLESIAFASYTGAGLSPTGANGALNSTLWRVDLVQDTNNDNTYGTTKTSAQAPELGRGLVNGTTFTGGIGAVQINATTRALFLQPTSAYLTPGFVEFRTKYSSNTAVNSLIDVTVRFFFFFFFFLCCFTEIYALQVEIYFWHLNNAARASSWKIGFYSGDTPAADVDATDEREWTTPATMSSSPVWTLDKVEFVFQVQYTTGDDYLFVRISGDDAPGATGNRDTIAISAITILAEKAGSSPTTTTGGGGATTTTTTATTAIGQTTTTTAPTQPGDTTTTGTTAVGDTTAPTSTTSTGTGNGGAGGATTTTVLVTGSTSAGVVASMAALVAFVATMAMAL
jgi:hypothetical protein